MNIPFCVYALFVSTLAVQAGAPIAGSARQPAGRPVARVNGTVLTDRDLLREMYAIFPYAAQHGGTFPKAMEPDIRKGAMKMIVFEELLYQEAQRRKVSVPRADTDRALAAFEKEFPTPEERQRFLKNELNGSEDLLKTRIRRTLLIEKMLKLEVADKAVASLADAKAFYARNPDHFRTAESFSLQTISIVPPANATPAQLAEARKRAEAALKQAKATQTYEQFGLLAEKISEDDYRVMMGDRRTVERSKLPPAIAQAALTVAPGQVTDLIPVEHGYTIVRLNAHMPVRMRQFAEIKDELRKRLEKIKTDRLRTALDEQLRGKAKVEEL